MYYLWVKAWIQIGDHKQLRAFGQTANIPNVNLLRHQIKVSHFERRKEQHWSSVTLREQHRRVEGLSWYSNETSYGKRKLDSPGYEEDSSGLFNQPQMPNKVE